MKSLLKEQRTTTEQQIAQQDKANKDMALSYLKMINVQIEAAKRKEREEQAYRECFLIVSVTPFIRTYRTELDFGDIFILTIEP